MTDQPDRITVEELDFAEGDLDKAIMQSEKLPGEPDLDAPDDADRCLCLTVIAEAMGCDAVAVDIRGRGE